MALSERQQVVEALKQAERPIIAFRKDWNPDSAASAAALFAMLKVMGKTPEIVCDGFERSEKLDFVPHLESVRPEMGALRKFVISIDVTKSKIGELSYEAKDGFLHIYLSPKGGTLDAKQVSTSATDYQHDLIITVDTPDLASLGGLIEGSGDFFHRTPILNIDSSPANEQYGHINHVDQTASSTGEMLFHLAKDLATPITSDLATAFLLGIISKTRAFKQGSFSPRTLAAASELVAAGGKRDLVVSRLYRTKTIPMLKLWGRALARMKFDPTHRIASSVLTQQDFVVAGANEKDLGDIIDELISSSPDAETILLIHEQADDSVCCTVRNDIRKNADRLTAPWDGAGSRTQSRCFVKGKPIVEIEKEMLEHLRKELAAA